MGADDVVGLDPAVALTRARAATRQVGGTTVVAPVGWATDVYDLSGAAAIVWDALATPGTVGEVAGRCDVEPSDELFAAAVSTLVAQGLVVADACG